MATPTKKTPSRKKPAPPAPVPIAAAAPAPAVDRARSERMRAVANSGRLTPEERDILGELIANRDALAYIFTNYNAHVRGPSEAKIAEKLAAAAPSEAKIAEKLAAAAPAGELRRGELAAAAPAGELRRADVGFEALPGGLFACVQCGFQYGYVPEVCTECTAPGPAANLPPHLNLPPGFVPHVYAKCTGCNNTFEHAPDVCPVCHPTAAAPSPFPVCPQCGSPVPDISMGCIACAERRMLHQELPAEGETASDHLDRALTRPRGPQPLRTVATAAAARPIGPPAALPPQRSSGITHDRTCNSCGRVAELHSSHGGPLQGGQCGGVFQPKPAGVTG